MKVVITPRGFARYGSEEIQRMECAGLEVDVNDTGSPYDDSTFLAKSQDADALIVGVDNVSAEFLSKCPRLKVVCKFGVGVDNIAVDYCEEHGITVGRTVGSNSVSVAEMVIAEMLADARYLVKSITDVKAGKWSKRTGIELYKKTLGIIGFGAIGRHVARIARGFEMNVCAYDISPISDDDAQNHGVKKTSFTELLRTCDYVSLHVPLTDSTRNMVAREELALMKHNACLINTSRGGVVNEDDLYEALRSGVIRSACFDVCAVEPPGEAYPLLSLDNFMLTAHIGSRTVEAEKRSCQISTDVVLKNLGLAE